MFTYLPLNEKAANFEKLPMICKEFFFKVIANDYACNFKDALPEFLKNSNLNYAGCKDGSAKLFNMAYEIFATKYKNEIKPENFIVVPINLFGSDFIIESVVEGNGTKLLVNIHGYDEKAEVGEKLDAETEEKIKINGNNYISFSQRELFENPMKCVMDAIDTFNDIAGFRKKDV